MKQFVVFLVFAATAADSKTITVNETHAKETVVISKGDTLIVKLLARPGTGSQWVVANKNSKYLEQIGESYFEPIPENEATVGGAMRHVYKFKALKHGHTELKMVYKRPFGDDSPRKRFNLKVVID